MFDKTAIDDDRVILTNDFNKIKNSALLINKNRISDIVHTKKSIREQISL